MKSRLRDDTVLVEGNYWQKTYRTHLADLYTTYSDRPEIFSAEQEMTSDARFDASSDAWIGRNISLAAVGGVAALVRADVHRSKSLLVYQCTAYMSAVGAVFPAYIFDHQLETEGFGRIARTLGARLVGLSNYIVLHKS